MVENYNCSGYATRNDLRCSDGRIIRKDAFMNQDGEKVPLVYEHNHKDVGALLGYAILENRDDGVYTYCFFNDTKAGQDARLAVEHGDVRSLSIYANKLKHVGNNVVSGIIREVSLVLSGANPGAYVDFVMAQGDEGEDGLYANYDETVLNIVLSHSDKKKNEDKDLDEGVDIEMATTKNSSVPEENKKTDLAAAIEALTDDQREALKQLLEKNTNDELYAMKHADEPIKNEDTKSKAKSASKSDEEKTIQDVFNTLTEEQKTMVYALVGMVLEDAKEANNEEENDDEEDNKDMKHNVFDDESKDVLTHSEMVDIMEDAKHNGSLRDAVLAHGIEQVDYLFPDAQSVDATPQFITRNNTWVAEVMNSVHKSPFSRVKSIFADLTEADARAKGYIKGNLKAEEFFSLMKRITTPTTIYKKQRIDRDDVVDITDFDVVAWLKTEMREMLDEEISRAILIGDGRSSSSNDKINEQSIRPIWTDDDVFTVKAAVNVTSSTSDADKAKAFIKACVKSRKNYKGSGNPVMFMPEDILTDCLLLEDTTGRIIYDTEAKLATSLRVSKIVPVEVMEGQTRTVGSNTHTLAGIYVNLADYNVGADKGGAVNLFDDFDIDYNSQKYLIETRCSGALTKPYSAVAIEFVQATEESTES